MAPGEPGAIRCSRSRVPLGGAYLAGNDGAERNKNQEQQQLLHDDLLGGLVAALYPVAGWPRAGPGEGVRMRCTFTP